MSTPPCRRRMTVIIVTREEWGAIVPRAQISTRLQLPTPELWLHHTAGNERGAAGMRQIERAHIAKGWRASGYSFVIDPATLIVYEGRGAGVLGAHTEGHNSRSHGICVMGNYEHEHVSDALVHTIADLIAHGAAMAWWPDHLTGGHRDTKPTACPGRHLHAAIRRINAEAEAILAGDTTPQPPQENPMAVPQPTLGDIQTFVTGAFNAADNPDERGIHYWTWQIAMAADWTVPARELRRQLGLK